MKKLSVLLSTALLALSIGVVPVSAATSDGSDGSTIGASVSVQGVPTVENEANSKISPMDAGYSWNTYDIRSESSKTFLSKKFVRYLTESWAQASGYTWSKAQATALTFTGNLTSEAIDKMKVQFGLSAGYTTTYTVAITLPATATQFSKLAFGADYYTQDFSFVKTTHYQTSYGSGEIVDPRVYSTYLQPTPNTYLYVVYQ
ncbi:hypothetical protein [Paenibacillus pedocola]|uniref:hypothetical protein n=1 Tax=Paenibacillus pedocola TaxID=3242193 RepID=UPI002877735F|nr:hypothetical protein [Paenibacillus typhae]